MPTPLREEPIIPEYLQPLMKRFWDVMLYKQNHLTMMSLHDIDAYMRLFEVKLCPYEIQLICSIDRHYVCTINKTIAERTPKQEP